MDRQNLHTSRGQWMYFPQWSQRRIKSLWLAMPSQKNRVTSSGSGMGGMAPTSSTDGA